MAVRVIAATHVALEEAIAEDRFREDLLARIAQVRMLLPPLRERPEDVLPLLAMHLEPRDLPPLAPDLVEALLLYRFPRNAREVQAIARSRHGRRGAARARAVGDRRPSARRASSRRAVREGDGACP